MTEEEMKIIKAVVKRAENSLAEIITKHICSDVFCDKQSEKRIFLTQIEVDFSKDMEEFISNLEIGFRHRRLIQRQGDKR